MHTSSKDKIHTNRRDWHNIKMAIGFLRYYPARALIAVSFLIFAKLAIVGIPVVLKHLIEHFEKTPSQLTVPLALVAAYGMLRIANSVFSELRDVLFSRVRYSAMQALSKQVLVHLHTLSLRFHLGRKTGAISRDIERGTKSIGSLTNYLVFSVLPITVEFLLVAYLLLSQYKPHFAMVTFAAVAVYILFTFSFTNWRMEHRLEMNRLDSEANTIAVESLINYETVKYFTNESHEINRYDALLSQWTDKAVLSQTSMSALNFGQNVIIALSVTVILYFATVEVSTGAMSIGDLVLVNTLMLQLFLPLGMLGMVYRQIKYTLADMDLVFKLLEQKAEIKDAPGANDLVVKKAKVRFNKVSFSYDEARPILHDIDFEIAAGQSLAIVGKSGSGKSTIARLMYRFYDPTAGDIQISDTDIKSISTDSLRRHIAVVPQDSVLFNQSIYYNIAYGQLNAREEAVHHAAEMAQLTDFIEALPDRWDTIVGERGLKLSGGEKQRIAIARAILNQPSIMLFDEATSALDSHTEKAIQATLKTVSKSVTTLIIAHRLSTITDANHIIVLDAGRIIEQGTFETLINLKGVFWDMWQTQQAKEQQ